ncbi:MAG: penicillin acylase family protein [Bacteroidota bacterium]|nr:penicillin acylase family protein [Bacteroidota bacterium]
MTRFLLGFGFVLVLLLVGLVALGVHFMSGTVTPLEGQATVRGISASVQIDRDEFAIPHIHGATEHDAWFGLGYAEAQDRLFQMEFARRVGQGRMSEVFGARTLTLDTWSRTIGFARIARAMWEKCGPHSREVLTAFTDGINARIREHPTKLGFEFDALKLVPEYWKPEDCLIVARLMSWQMNFAYLSDAAYGDFALALDSLHMRSLFPDYAEDGATIVDGVDPRNFVSNYLHITPVPATSISPARAILASAPIPPAPPAKATPVTKVTPKTAKSASAPKATNGKQSKSPTQTKPAKPQPKTPAPLPHPNFKPPKPHIPNPPPRIGAAQFPKGFIHELYAIQRSVDSILGPRQMGGGSNAFAVAPQRSASNGALLENDAHLKLDVPARWYLAHITSDDGLNVAGFLIPGMPVFEVGRTPDLSWGVSAAMADETDFFIEHSDSTGTYYQIPGGTWRAFSIIHDTIRIRDSAGGAAYKHAIDIQLTTDGPIVSGLHPDSLVQVVEHNRNAGGIPDTTFFHTAKPVAMQWNGLYAVSDEIAGYLNLTRAKTVNEARAGMTNFATPCLNLCLADRRGNVGYQFIGRLPRRSGSEDRIMLPRDGTNAADAWQGFITMAQLPSVTNPPRGYIVSANNAPMKSRPFPISNDWEPSARADRISELVEHGGKLSTGDIARIQLDVISPYDLRHVLQYILAMHPDPHPPRTTPDSTSVFRLDSMDIFWKEDSIRKHGTNVSDSMMRLVRQKDSAILAVHRQPEDTIKAPKVDRFTTLVLEYLRNWDGGMRPEEIAPAIYSVFLNRLIYNTFHDELGTQRYQEFIGLENLPLSTLQRILPDTGNIWWRDATQNTITWDNASGLDVAKNPRDSIIEFSFRESLRILATSFGRDIRQWQWGRMHTLTMHHPFSQSSALIAKLADVQAGPMHGGPTTVLQAMYHLWAPYEEVIGPSMRMIADMKTDELLAVLPTGNSEAIFGDHYRDMLNLYKQGALVRLSLTQHKPEWKRWELRPE